MNECMIHVIIYVYINIHAVCVCGRSVYGVSEVCVAKTILGFLCGVPLLCVSQGQSSGTTSKL